MSRVLLVQPKWNSAKRTKHPAKLAPVGLYKLMFYHKEKGDEVSFVEGCCRIGKDPEIIHITSLFTYWSRDVFNTISYYRCQYPKAQIHVGGILASLIPEEVRKRFPDVLVHEGLDDSSEDVRIDWKELKSPIQIIHASRGCIRKCTFCGVRKIEKKITYKTWAEVKKEIQLNEIVFFDNNFLMSPHHEKILKGIEKLRVNGKVVRCECQSGFDPRLMTQKDANLLKKARFKSIRLSWDHGLHQMKVVRKALEYLNNAGFGYKTVGVFMLFNYEIPFEILEKKRGVCKEWNVQIFHCRYRPLDQLYDNYNPRSKSQSRNEYYIHPTWTDKQIRKFGKNVREQNIVIRFNFNNIEQYYTWLRDQKKTGRLVKRKLNLDADLDKWR